MNIAILLMSGIGSRIESKVPKQYIEINDKPIFIYTIENFIENKNIDKIILVIEQKWEEYVLSKIKKNIKNDNKNIEITYGGKTRNQSFCNAIDFCEKNNLSKNDIIITHDVARIFITQKIIDDNIYAIKNSNNSIVNTCLKVNDTISYWSKNKIIKFLNRDKLFLHQTPQTATFDILKKISNYINKKNLNSTDLISVAKKLKLKILNIDGDLINFKITRENDLEVVKKIIKR